MELFLQIFLEKMNSLPSKQAYLKITFFRELCFGIIFTVKYLRSTNLNFFIGRLNERNGLLESLLAEKEQKLSSTKERLEQIEDLRKSLQERDLLNKELNEKLMQTEQKVSCNMPTMENQTFGQCLAIDKQLFKTITVIFISDVVNIFLHKLQSTVKCCCITAVLKCVVLKRVLINRA